MTSSRSSAEPAVPAVPVDSEDEPLADVLERIRPHMARMLRKYDIPVQDAEDVVQEALVTALNKWDTIRYKEGWILGALRFKCSNYWKKKRSERVQAMDTPALEELSEPQPPGQEREEIVLDLRSLVRTLGARPAAALWLRFGVGLSVEEVAERLGYCPSSIRKLTGRSLARLQKLAAPGPKPA